MSTASYQARMFGYAFRAMMHQTMSWGNGNWKCALMDYTSGWGGPNQDTQEKWSDISAYECAGGGYSTKTVTFPDTIDDYQNGATPGGQARFFCNDIVWTGLTCDTNVAVIYYSGGGGYLSPLLGYVMFTNGSHVTPVAQTFTVSFNSGIAMTLDLATS